MSKPYTIITGASEGIGRGFAIALAAQGHDLVIVARNGARLRELAAELEMAHQVDILVVEQDLAVPGAARAVRNAIGDLPVDCLINNAGFQVAIGPFAQSDAEAVRAMIAVNVVALTDLTHLMLPAILAARGAIINVASHAASSRSPTCPPMPPRSLTSCT